MVVGTDKLDNGQNQIKAWSYILKRQRMHSFVRYYGHKLQTLFQKRKYFAATYQQQLCRLPTTVSTLNEGKQNQKSWHCSDLCTESLSTTL